MSESEQVISIPFYLAERLSQWHSSMGDPVYAVSSSGLAKRPVPRSVFERATENMRKNSIDPRLEEHKNDAHDIYMSMKSMLGRLSGEELLEAVVVSCASTLWALAWANEADERGVQYSQAMVAAPSTPDSAVKKARELVSEFLSMNEGLTLDALHDRFYNLAPEASALGHELAMGFSGAGGDLPLYENGYKEPRCEAYYYDFMDEWVEE